MHVLLSRLVLPCQGLPNYQTPARHLLFLPQGTSLEMELKGTEGGRPFEIPRTAKGFPLCLYFKPSWPTFSVKVDK